MTFQPLNGKIALVTGASRGIGRAVARKLAQAGCDVAVGYFNNRREGEAVCGEIRALGRRALLLRANVGDPASVAGLVESFRGEFDRLDLLISNAASGVLKPASELTLKHWRWCLEINALALNLLAQRLTPIMPPGSRIVAMSSLGAQRAIPLYGFVAASKAALEALVRTLALELGGQGIRVNAVSAGIVDTDALRAFPHRDELLDAFAIRAPLGATLTPEQVAGAVYLLCLPESEMVTGHTLVVDGGYSIAG